MTDSFYAESSMQSDSGHTNTRLMARRVETRRVAAKAQDRIDLHGSASAMAGARTTGTAS